ncbi:NAD kinase [Polynucleobacter kasalickyi]
MSLWFNRRMSIENNSPLPFSNVALVGKFQAEGVDRILENVARIILENGFNAYLESETAEQTGLQSIPTIKVDDFAGKIDIVVVIGGDGTLLGLGRRVAGLNIPIIGINMGRLGYMTDIPLNEIEVHLPAMLNGAYELDTRTLLESQVMRDGAPAHQGTALNDVVVNRSSRSGMVELTVEVNGSFMYNQRSDGLIVATPTGSTAYSLSAGGPILHPRLAGIVLAPVSPHALSNRPIVLPDDAFISIEITGGRDVTVHFDMQTLAILQTGDRVTVKKSPKKVILLHPVGHSEYRTLREKLHWNEYPTNS